MAALGVEADHKWWVTGMFLVATMWWNSNKKISEPKTRQERLVLREKNQKILWSKSAKVHIRSLSKKTTEDHPLSEFDEFMTEPEKWSGPRQFPALQNRSYQLVGSLLAELEDSQQLSVEHAMNVMQVLLQRMSKSDARRTTYYAQETNRTGGRDERMWEFTFPDPLRLKMILIGLQTGRLRFNDGSPEGINQQVEEALEAKRRDLPSRFHDVHIKGFPALPASMVERKLMLREYLMWMAEEPSALFDMAKIDRVLDTPGFLESLTDEGHGSHPVVVVDPLNFDPFSQQVRRMGVLPRALASKIGAVQFAGTLVVQLDANPNRTKRKLLMLVRPQDRAHGGTLSFTGAVDFEPGVEMESVLKRLLPSYLGFPAGHVLSGLNDPAHWEKVKHISAQIYNADKGEDIQFRETYIYLPPEEERQRIELSMAAWEGQKINYAGPEAFEATLLRGHRRARAIVEIDVEYLFELARNEAPGPFVLNETFRDGHTLSTVIPVNPDVVVPFLGESSEGTDRLINGRHDYEVRMDRKLSDIATARKEGADYLIYIDHNVSMFDGHPLFSLWGTYFNSFIEKAARPILEAIMKLQFRHMEFNRRGSNQQFAIPSGRVHPFLQAIRHMQELAPQTAALFSSIEQVNVMSGRFFDSRLISPLHSDQELTSVLFARESLGANRFAVWVHENSLATVMPYIEGPLATAETSALVAMTAFYHEAQQGGSVTHEDLVKEGASFDRLIDSLENGTENPFLDDMQRETGISWRREHKRIAGYRVQAQKELAFEKSRLEAALAYLTLALKKNQADWAAREGQLQDEILALKREARTDALTQLANRKGLDEQLDTLMVDAKESGRKFAVIPIDLDGFKGVNDTYGHAEGDNLLVDFANCVRIAIGAPSQISILKGRSSKDRRELSRRDPIDRRTKWLGARQGGDEFIIVASDVTADQAKDIALTIQKLFVHLAKDLNLPVSASFGVAAYEAGDDKTSLLKRADAMLYEAKRNGKNRIEVADPNHRLASMYDTHPAFSILQNYFQGFTTRFHDPIRKGLELLGIRYTESLQRLPDGKFDFAHHPLHPIFASIYHMQLLSPNQVSASYRVQQFNLLAGRFDHKHMAAPPLSYTEDDIAGVMLLRESLGSDQYAVWAHRKSFASVEPYMSGPLATIHTSALVSFTMFFHENTQSHLDVEMNKKNDKPLDHRVTHDELVAYGASFDRLIDSLENGTPNPFLDRVQSETGLDWKKEHRRILAMRQKMDKPAWNPVYLKSERALYDYTRRAITYRIKEYARQVKRSFDSEADLTDPNILVPDAKGKMVPKDYVKEMSSFPLRSGINPKTDLEIPQADITFKLSDVSAESRREMAGMILRGEVLHQMLWAGEASRLKKDLKEKNIDVTDEELAAMYFVDIGFLNNQPRSGLVGPREILQLRLFVEGLAAEFKDDFHISPEEAVQNQPFLWHFNDKTHHRIEQDMMAHEFYGFNPDNMLILPQHVNQPFELSDGELQPGAVEENVALGHGWPALESVMDGVAFQIRTQNGVQRHISGDALQFFIDRGVKMVHQYRINDFYGLTEQAVELEYLAREWEEIRAGRSFYLARMVSNDSGQKGGVPIRPTLIQWTGTKLIIADTLSMSDEQSLAFLASQKTSAPYHRFANTYEPSVLRRELRQHGLTPDFEQKAFKMRDGSTKTLINPQYVTGMITTLLGMMAKTIHLEGQVINDFKDLSNVKHAYALWTAQAQNPAFASLLNRVSNVKAAPQQWLSLMTRPFLAVIVWLQAATDAIRAVRIWNPQFAMPHPWQSLVEAAA